MKKAIIVIFILVAGVMLFNTYHHESAHKQIMLYFGCQDATIDIIKGEARCVGGYYEGRSEETHIREYTLHSLNEIVGYNLQTAYLLMFVIIILQVIQIEKQM